MKNIIALVSVFLFTLNNIYATVYTGMNIGGAGYITLGKNFYLSEATGFRMVINNNFSAPNFKNQLDFYLTDNNSSWSFFVSVPVFQTISPGKFTNIVKLIANNPGEVGMRLGGEGRGTNVLPGSWINIVESEWSIDGKLLKFAADFHYLGEAYQTSITDGSLRYNSTIPFTTIPEPGAPMIMISSLLLFWRRRR